MILKAIVSTYDNSLYLVEIKHNMILQGTIPRLFPITSELEGLLEYSDLSEDEKKYIRDNYKMLLVNLTVYK